MESVRWAASLCLLLLIAAPCAGSNADRKRREHFEKRIRPILVKHCYQCHSAKSKSLKGALRLDSADAWRKGGDSGPAIEPGKPAESLLLQALRYDGLEMPPDARLPANVVKDFEIWIRDGAFDPRLPPERSAPQERVIDIEKGREFWAFRPPARRDSPEIRDAAWPVHWVDRFLLAELEKRKLRPAEDVDRGRLARRLYFDLTGLPPTTEQLRAFINDQDPRAVERLVDRLLHSQSFGEHWGRMWLDVARYADSNGSDFNATFHNAWRYRDYVVKSFNADKPLALFVREQLAGDLLPFDSDAQRADQLAATGFLMLGPKMLSERDKEKLRMDVVDEQIDSLGRAFLGMTLGCARCHDHKFDPIPTADYYALAGILRSTATLEGEIQKYVSNWVRRPLPIDAAHDQAIKTHRQKVAALTKTIAGAKQRVAALRKALAQRSTRELGVLVDDVDAEVVGQWKKSTFSKNFVGKGYLHDDNKGKGSKSVTFRATLPSDGEYELRIAFAAGKGRSRKTPLRIVHGGGEQKVLLDQQPTPPIENLFKPLGRFSFRADRPAVVEVSTGGAQGHVIVDAVQFIPVEQLAKFAAEKPDPRAQRELDEAEQALKKLEADKKKLDENSPPPAPVALAVGEHDEIGDCHLRIRGEPGRRADLIPRGFLRVARVTSASPPIPSSGSGRLELADWIADRRHPLTARVMVNRVWAKLFGEGLVRSIDNFGHLGQRPTHPELLDRLAIEFLEHDTSIKYVVRLLATSRAYRMSARMDENAWRIDPDNRWLWRAHRKPLPAEAMRDAMLRVSGRLDLSPGNSPVANLGVLVNKNSADAKTYERKDSTRRSLYLPIIRNELPPLLALFDFADPDFVTGKRNSTTTPAQALLLLNSPFVRQCAAAAAADLTRGEPDDEAAAGRAYQLLLSRRAEPHELTRAVAFVKAAGASSSRREAWTQLVQAMMASTEFRMLD